MKKRQGRVNKPKKARPVRKSGTARDKAVQIDWSASKRVIFPELKPTTRTVPVRFPVYMIEELKHLANRYGIPYQSLMKLLLEEKLQERLYKNKRKLLPE